MNDRESLIETAMGAHGAKEFETAEALYRHLLALLPADAGVLHLLGVLRHQQGWSHEGRDLIAQAIRQEPKNAVYHNNLASVLLGLGDAEAAAKAARAALALAVDYPDAFVNLATALMRLDRLEEAGVAYRDALLRRGDHVESWFLFGTLLIRQERTEQAIEVFAQALSLDPGHLDSHLALAAAHKACGRLDAAIACYAEVLARDPYHPVALNNQGNLCQMLGRTAEAEALYRALLDLLPDHAGARGNLATLLQAQGRFDEAIECYRQALVSAPEAADIRQNLATALKRSHRLSEAITEYRHALALAPDLPEALNGLGSALQAAGHVDAAVGLYERALLSRPRFHEPLNHLMFALNSLPAISQADLLAAARRWTDAWPPVVEGPPHENLSDPERPLRIGYVSPDFRRHPVGYFLTGVLAHHDPLEVVVYCYSNSLVEDDITLKLRGHAQHWRSIHALDDRRAAAMIRADAIDILVDLSGHMADHRLPLFQQRPAPVQATWLGFFSSTGLAAIDHIIADATIIPASDDAFYREQVWRLPGCYLCFDGGTIDLPVGPPRAAGEPITFGCLNRRDKMSAPALAAWAAILARVPDARLLLKTASFSDATTRHEMVAAFATHGIAADRLIIEGASPRPQHLATYHRVDLALDPFPYTGATTTAETLWMGVPLITLRGRTFVGRVSASMLEAIGHGDLIAETVEEYIEQAVALATDRARLATLRTTLRADTRRGLCDGETFARALEAIFRGQWRQWCATRTP